ncbi:MAG: hypothetical protein ACKOXB_01500 [Flavobacteriales bacterium]
MERTAFDKIITLQSGLYCHFYKDLVVINDRMMIEERDLGMDLEKTTDNKKLRYGLNILLTMSILTMIIITGFYPLALLVFITIWDLKNIKRQTLPLLVSDCFPVKNITSAKFISGKLGFNHIDLVITNDNGKKMMKILKLYDSKEETMKAIGIFKEMGLFKDNTLDFDNTILQNQESFKINDTESLYLLEKEVVMSKKNIYPERAEYVGANNVVFIFTLIVLAGAVAIKSYQILVKEKFVLADYIVLALLLLIFQLPFKYFNKSTADIIDRNLIVKIYVTEKKGKATLTIEFKSEWYFPLKRKIDFEDAAEARKALEALKS